MRQLLIGGVLLLSTLCFQNALAVEMTRPLARDHRIKVVVYQANNVVPVHASTFTTTQIVFGAEEVIENIQNGDLVAWTVSVQRGLGHMLFLKPTLEGSDTNMTVVTNRHTYYFHLMSRKENPKQRDESTYAIHFLYPAQATALPLANGRHQLPGLPPFQEVHHSPEAFNWHYSFSGSRTLMPRAVFDDGQFTYVKLYPGQPVPAIFAIDDVSGKESVVNDRKEGAYLVVQQIAAQFTLRLGRQQVASLFNNRLIHRLRATQ